MDGFVLAGGRSRRMGRDKAAVVWAGSTLLERAVRTLQSAGFAVGVVRAADQPAESAGCPLVIDLVAGAGPLGGILTSLAASTSPACAVLACDLPLVGPELFRSLLGFLKDWDAAAPVDSTGRVHPLCALYKKTCLPAVRRRVDQGRLKTVAFLESREIRCRLVAPGEHRLSDRCFHNLNSPADWASLEGGN